VRGQQLVAYRRAADIVALVRAVGELVALEDVTQRLLPDHHARHRQLDAALRIAVQS
jgi:hypothetical protein